MTINFDWDVEDVDGYTFTHEQFRELYAIAKKAHETEHRARECAAGHPTRSMTNPTPEMLREMYRSAEIMLEEWVVVEFQTRSRIAEPVAQFRRGLLRSIIRTLRFVRRVQFAVNNRAPGASEPAAC